MTKKLQTLLALALVGGTYFNTEAQSRYQDEIFTDAQIIKAQSNQVYGINVDFLKNQQLYSNAYIEANLAQITSEHNEIRDSLISAITNGTAPNIPTTYYTPFSSDPSTIIKLITPLANNPANGVYNPFQMGMMDVYMPSPAFDTETNRPVMIYIHTGNFLPKGINGGVGGSKDDSAAVEFCRQWAKRGYVAVAPNYRLGWNPLGATQSDRTRTLLNGVFRGITDIKQVVRSLKTNAAALGIDGDKITIYGQGSGGYVALAYNFLDKYSETELEKFDPDLTGITVINQDYVGEISGLGGLLNFYQYQSVPGTSADIAFCVNAGGALGDKSWIEGGEAPNLSIHALRDPFAPFTAGTVIVPTTNEPVVDADGPSVFMPVVNSFGNNDVLENYRVNDPITARARSQYGATVTTDIPIIIGGTSATVDTEAEGLFTLMLPAGESSPWDWWSESDFTAYHGYLTALGISISPAQDILDGAAAGNPNIKSQSLSYIDTIQGYIHPRIMVALQIGEWEALKVSELSSELDNVAIYPNPASTSVNFKSNNPETAISSIKLIDITGRVAYRSANMSSNLVELNTTNLTSGIYMGIITLENGEEVIKKFSVN
jgi:hypothetical protein